jgi:transforming growth factor-beta-induced protein
MMNATAKVNLIETIVNQDKFAVFSRLMKSSKANEILRGEGRFTVFAPTNDAFKKIPEAQMNDLLSETGQEQLRAVLSYHIVRAKLLAGNVASIRSATSISGHQLIFTDVSGIKINGAAMQDRNIEATNGVVHAIDTVLTPPPIATAVAATATATTAKPITQPLI